MLVLGGADSVRCRLRAQLTQTPLLRARLAETPGLQLTQPLLISPKLFVVFFFFFSVAFISHGAMS